MAKRELTVRVEDLPQVMATLARLQAENERLRAWKREAIEVIRAWELVHDALGRPGRLGESKAVASVREVERLLSRRCARTSPVEEGTEAG